MTTRTMSKARVAVYARYSDDSQNPLSIDDQFRRALEHLTRMGIESTEVLRFVDEDMSGYKKKEAYARPGFALLLQAWDADGFDVLVVDEFSRLGRNPRQQLEIFERLDETKVRLICADGIDTNLPGSRLALGMKGIMAQEESRSTSYRVKRGMIGQLVRGYMMAPPPFGYEAERQYGECGRKIGTVWHVVETQAEVVRKMYKMRNEGVAYDKIARWLNETSVPTMRGGRIWRAACVQRVLQNTVYRGEVSWNSENSTETPLFAGDGRQVFERPTLRLVSDVVWHGAQSEKISRTGYGGGKSPYAGILECGHCGSMLSSAAKGRAFACGTCAANRLVGDADAPTSVPSISVAGLTEVVRFALERVFDDERIELLRRKLRERLARGSDGELSELRKKRDRLNRSAQHLVRLICQREQIDPLLDAEYATATEESRAVERQIKALETAQTNFARRDIEAQLCVDPRTLIDKLLDGKLPPEQLRAIFSQLFPRFVFVGRESRFIARFEIQFAPGVAVAWLSGTHAMLDESVGMKVTLFGSARRPVEWKIVAEAIESEAEEVIAESPEVQQISSAPALVDA